MMRFQPMLALVAALALALPANPVLLHAADNLVVASPPHASPPPTRPIQQESDQALVEAAANGTPFPTVVNLATNADGAHSVQTADLDRDGDLDVIAASRDNGQIVWHNNLGGQPVRFAAQTLATASGVYMAVPADINRDGWPDIVVAAVGVVNSTAVEGAAGDAEQAALGAGSLFWLENRIRHGQGFARRSIADGLNYPVAIAIADLDDDTDPDIIVPTRDDSRVLWYENQGNGAVFRLALVGANVPAAVGVYSGDVDNDGNVDVLAAAEDSNQIFWFRNNGATPPVFEPRLVRNGPTPPTGQDFAKAVFAADVDGDGDLDIPFASEQQNQFGWYENQGKGAAFVERLIATDALHAKAIVASDVDLDGDMDLLGAASENNSITLFENKGGSPPRFVARLITGAARGARSVAAADIDGDGDIDLLSASRDDDRIAFYPNLTSHRTAVFDPQSQYIVSTYRESRSAEAADIDGDGDMDILSVSDEIVAWHRNEGGTPPRFTHFVINDLLSGGRWVHADDIDGDGDMDVISADNVQDTIIWYPNLMTKPGDTPTFAGYQVSTLANGVRDVRSADIDRDGDPDLISASDSDNMISWYENKTGRNGIIWERHIVTDAAKYARSSYAADLDGDGDMDILSASAEDNVVAWYENREGGGTFIPHILTRTAKGARHVHADDLDGDGDIDILAASELDNTIRWFENKRGVNTNFDERIVTGNAFGVHAVSTGDADHDGDMDIFAAMEAGARVDWLENDGATPPNFIQHTIAGNFAMAHSIAAADVDGDGDVDPIATSRGGGQIAWFENQGGQYNVAENRGQVTNSALQVISNLVFAHRGRASDAAMVLNALSLRFTASGRAMTSNQANDLFSKLLVYHDSNYNGAFDGSQDAQLVALSSFPLDSAGQLLVSLPSGAGAVQTAPGGTNRYFVVVETRGSGCLPAGSVQITHVANAQTILNGTTGFPMRAEYMRSLDAISTPDADVRPTAVINEVVADNTGFFEDPDEPLEYPDWFEIYNPSSAALDLGGMFLTDDPDQPELFRIPDGVTLPAYGYLVFIADEEPEQGPLHTNFRLSKGGETIVLYDAELRGNRLIDQVTFEGLGPDVAFGRYPNGGADWTALGYSTPGGYNLNAPLVINTTFYLPFVASSTGCR